MFLQTEKLRPDFPHAQVQTMVIPAAGYGTRMRELTGGGSKELLPVRGRPALGYALQEAVAAGIRRVGVIIRKGKEEIIEAVRSDPCLVSIAKNLDIDFFYQTRANGEAGAIWAAAQWIGDASFAVYYPDNVIADQPSVLAELVARQSDLQKDLVLLTRHLDHVQAPPCGLEAVSNNLYCLNTLEKPLDFPYGLRPTGIYIATSYFLRACGDLMKTSNSGEIKDRDVRYRMYIVGYKTYGVDLDADVLDIGNYEGYSAADN